MTAALCALVILLGADAFDTEFKGAHAAASAGDHATAVQGYERMIASGAVDATVFYNLGCAYYQQGQLGPAIANFERALAVDPVFTEALENLEKVVGETPNKLPKPLRPAWQQALLFWDTSLSYAAARALALGLWLAFWGLLVLLLIRRVPYGRSIAVLFLGLATLSGLSAWCKAYPLPLAVGVAEAAPVHYGTSDADAVRFTLAQGDRVAVERRADGWLLVRSVDDVRGWVREEHVCLVGPPYTAPPSRKETDTGS